MSVPICARPDCGQPLTPRKRGGNPKIYCSKRCGGIVNCRKYEPKRDYTRRDNARRRVAFLREQPIKDLPASTIDALFLAAQQAQRARRWQAVEKAS